jgi:rhodanese-related sulfurtransferase
VARAISAQDLKRLLSEPDEIALLDVREHGQYGEGHPFFAVPCPYSQFETRVGTLVPNTKTRLVVLDDGDGVAAKAAARAEALGYGHVETVEGGAPAWAAAGYTLYEGVNLPSKTFGELLEIARHTPRLSAEQVRELEASGKPHVIVDGRPYSEYAKFNIPGGVCCPNGELALRIGTLAPDPDTTIVVNCAGRTRSILGAQTLIDFGVPNPVYALENGTQGWFLAGLELENGADRRGDANDPTDLDARQAKAAEFIKANAIPVIDGGTLSEWRADAGRTLYVFDVRTAEEFARDGAPGTVHAPGGQLVQATDQWVGVRNARIVLLDDDGVRAPLVCNWLRRMGHDAAVLGDGVAGARAQASELASVRGPQPDLAPPPAISPAEFAALAIRPLTLDLRGSMAYRAGHISGATWAIRPRLPLGEIESGGTIVLIAESSDVAALAAEDLREAGIGDLAVLNGTPAEWTAAGLDVVPSETPADADCIDYLFFTHTRHAGDEAAARQYLEWEIGLVDQLDEQERGIFRVDA